MTHSRPGFTLVEIVVVLLILGTVAAVSVPAFRDSASPNALHDGTARVVRVLERARITARMNGQRVTVTLDPKSQRFWIDNPPLQGTLDLPGGVTLWSERQRPRIVFEPAGGVSADVLAVQSAGRAMAVRVDPFTGEIDAR